MRCHNKLPAGDPYEQSKTAAQWRKDGRALIDGATGEEMWTNAYRQDKHTYYTADQTREATPDDLAAWHQADLERARERRARLRAKRQYEAEALARREQGREEYIRRNTVAYSHVDPRRIVCLDVETTGLDIYHDEVVQIGIIDGCGNTLMRTLVRPINHTEWPGAEAVHGISPADVEGAPTMDDLLPAIDSILAGADLIIGYNTDGYDLPLLAHRGVQIPRNVPRVDVMRVYAVIYGDWSDYHKDYRYQRLQTCADCYGYRFRAHDALEDVRATLYCWYRMMGMDVDQWTGTPLTPGDPERCLGNGQRDGYPMCCDECNYLAACNPVSSD